MPSAHVSLVVQASKSSHGSGGNTTSHDPAPSHSSATHSAGSPHDVPCGSGVPPPQTPPVHVCALMQGLLPHGVPSGDTVSAGQLPLAPLQKSAGLQSIALRHRTDVGRYLHALEQQDPNVPLTRYP